MRAAFFDKFATALLTLVVTGVGGGLVSYMFTAYTRAAERRAEQAKSRATLGVTVEHDVVAQTGTLNALLKKARLLAVNVDPGEARAYFDHTLKPPQDDWTDQVLQVRNKVGQAFGADVASKVEDTSGRNFTLDVCGRVIRRQDKVNVTDCDRLAQTEREAHDWTMEQHKHNKPIAAEAGTVHAQDAQGNEAALLYPIDFHANMRIATMLVYRPSTCRAAEKRGRDAIALAHVAAPSNQSHSSGTNRPAPPVAEPADSNDDGLSGVRCGNIQGLTYIVNSRVNLVGV